MRIGLIALLVGLSTYGWVEDTLPIDKNYTGRITDPVQVCMVKKTIHTRTPYTHEFEGKIYHFCCTACLTKFKADPGHLKWATDPVNGTLVDKADALMYSYQGRAYFLSSEKTLRKFTKKPGKYLKKEDPTS